MTVLDRVTLKVVPGRPIGAQALTAAQTRDVYYAYDLRNLQLSARFDSQSGEGITSAFDGFGRLTSSSVNLGGTTRTLTYGHDRNGNRTSIAHPDGNVFNTLYDGANRPRQLLANGATNLAATNYTPYGAPALTLRIGNAVATAQGYDGVLRPTVRVHYFTPGISNAVWSYDFNPASQLSAVARDNDAFAWTGHYAVQRPYTTNGLNQYSAAGSATFGYDPNGNLTSDGSRTFVYDIENRLVSSSNGAALVYDPLGRLFQVSGPMPGGGTGTTRLLYDADALVAEYDQAGNMLRRHVHNVGADVPMVTYEGSGLGTVRQLLADHQGSIVAHADASGAAVQINRYDEYGIPAATNTSRFQYTGQAWLAELGMYYYKARIYSPTLGRFLQTDPVGYEGGSNLYAYVGNDPVNAIDPHGLYECRGSREDCARIRGLAAEVRQAARNAESQSGSRIRSQAATSLNALSRFIGTEGDRNGVQIVSADLPRGVLGDAGDGPNGSVVIQLDLSNIDASRGSTGAGVLAHEGTHAVQEVNRGPARTLDDVFHREVVANTMESVTNQYLGQETSVWSRKMTAVERRSRIRESAFQSCDYARRQYPRQYGGQTCPR